MISTLTDGDVYWKCGINNQSWSQKELLKSDDAMLGLNVDVVKVQQDDDKKNTSFSRDCGSSIELSTMAVDRRRRSAGRPCSLISAGKQGGRTFINIKHVNNDVKNVKNNFNNVKNINNNNNKNICDCDSNIMNQDCSKKITICPKSFQGSSSSSFLTVLNLCSSIIVFVKTLLFMCLNKEFKSNKDFLNSNSNEEFANNTSIEHFCCYKSNKNKLAKWMLFCVLFLFSLNVKHVQAIENEFESFQSINLEKSIAAVLHKVAYGSTTKRSIPDNAYPVTTLATPLLTTYRYSDGNEEWQRVDVRNGGDLSPRSNVDFDEENAEGESNRRDLSSGSYGADLEKDHALPTSAPAADILKNNNNKNYNNPNRYNNDRLKPAELQPNAPEQVTENVAFKTTTTYNLLRNVRPTKSMYSKEPPRYVPPLRVLFTPPIPPEYQNPFLDKPTLRGTSSDGFGNRRPIPPPSLMPNKDRIPYRPDLPKVNMEKTTPDRPAIKNNNDNANNEPPRPSNNNNNNNNGNSNTDKEKKKSLNTPSQNVRISEVYGLNRNVNESNFEYEKSYVPSITRILSGSNGRHDDIPDILLRTVTATPNIMQKSEAKSTKTRAPAAEPSLKIMQPDVEQPKREKEDFPTKISNIPTKMDDVATKKQPIDIYQAPLDRSESVVTKKDIPYQQERENERKIVVADVTTQMSDMINLPNVKEKETGNGNGNVTLANSEEIWLICWNVHVYLVVFCYILLAIFSIYKLIRYENDPHMFSKSYFLTIHLMLTVICVLRIFYLTYDPYNSYNSFNTFLYDFLHTFPLSLLATTFAVLILFLLKRTLTHLEVKTRPFILVVFALLHILLCFCLSIFETLGYLETASLTICKPVFVLLTWALGCSYLYLYRLIKNVLAKKSQNLSEMCTQNISYASHITIAVALLFILLGCVQMYALFFIKNDRFNGPIKHHWILWGYELSVRFIEISIITLLAIVVSLKMSQREKQSAGGFPLFPCTTNSDSSTDNIYPNNCNTNPNALNYSRQEMNLDSLPAETVERPNLLKNAFQNESFEKKSYQSDSDRGSNFDRFERPKWGSDRYDSRQNMDNSSNMNLNNFIQLNSGNFDRSAHNSARNERGSARKTYDTAKYYVKPKYDLNSKYDLDYNNDDEMMGGGGGSNGGERNIYSEPVDNNLHHQYERTRHEFERSDFDRRSRNSSNTSGRRSTGRARKNHPRAHLGAQTLPNHQMGDSMLVDEQGFVRFRHMQDDLALTEKPKKFKKPMSDLNHYSDA